MSVPIRALAVIVGGLLWLTPCDGHAAQGPPSRPWWKSDVFQKDLGLTPDQGARIDAIFLETLPELRQHKDELDRHEAQVSRLIETDADEATVARQIDKAEAARGRLNKVRTLMLMRMRQTLTPDQRVRFKALHERLGSRHRSHGSRQAPDAQPSGR